MAFGKIAYWFWNLGHGIPQEHDDRQRKMAGMVTVRVVRTKVSQEERGSPSSRLEEVLSPGTIPEEPGTPPDL